MRTTFTVFALVTLAVGTAAACKLNRSDYKGYSRGELRSNSYGEEWRKAQEAVCILERNGWRNIPQQYLPSGWTHSDLMRQMACIANKESSFGNAPYGPDTGCGNAYGYWQVASCHLGRSIGGYRCPGVSADRLAGDPNIAAQCALYVYMERAMNGASGLGPWEATCSSGERNEIRSDGQPLFPASCGALECGRTFRATVAQDGRYVDVSVSSECPATKVHAWLLDVPQEGGTPRNTGRGIEAILQDAGGTKSTRVDLTVGAVAGVSFNKVRLALLKNETEYHRTNPSLALPVPLQGGSVQQPQQQQPGQQGPGTSLPPSEFPTDAERAARCAAITKMTTCLYSKDQCDWRGRITEGHCVAK